MVHRSGVKGVQMGDLYIHNAGSSHWFPAKYKVSDSSDACSYGALFLPSGAAEAAAFRDRTLAYRRLGGNFAVPRERALQSPQSHAAARKNLRVSQCGSAGRPEALPFIPEKRFKSGRELAFFVE
jgi:hypothetical protein